MPFLDFGQGFRYTNGSDTEFVFLFRSHRNSTREVSLKKHKKQLRKGLLLKNMF